MLQRALVGVALLMAPCFGGAGEIVEVEVVNLPEVQRIEGQVSFDGPIYSAAMVTFDDVVASPVRRLSTNRLILAGTLDTEGFAFVNLSLAAELKGAVSRGGDIGVILVPDEGIVTRALRDEGLFLFPIEAKEPAAEGSSGWVTTKPKRVEIAFPRYLVYIYNETDKSIAASVFAYLTNS